MGRRYRNKLSGMYSHRILTGIGHTVPQEVPQAVVDVDYYGSVSSLD